VRAHSCERKGDETLTGERSFTHRSPWTNEYVPSLPDGTKPSPRLRVLEEAANDAFSIYREMYYEGTGISSVYLWDLEDPTSSSAPGGGSNSFAGVVLLKKTATGGKSGDGSWDSIHVFEVAERSRTGTYKLTSTVSIVLVSSPGEQADTEHVLNHGTGLPFTLILAINRLCCT
jgi:capping protein beta